MAALPTQHLLLSPPQPSDEALFVQLYTDAAVMRHIGPPLATEQAAAAFARASVLSGQWPFRYRLWTVTHAQEGALGVAALSGDADGAEIGVMLLPHAQGRGHAVECIQRLVLHAFEELGLPRVFTRHADAHTRALGLMRKLGFAPVPPTGSGEPACRWERKRP